MPMQLAEACMRAEFINPSLYGLLGREREGVTGEAIGGRSEQETRVGFV